MIARQASPRRGGACIVAMVVLGAIAIILGVVAQQQLSYRRQVQRRQAQLQARWLARAGIERAAARLLRDPEGYQGETLTPLPGGNVRVVIRPDGKDAYVVESSADFASDPARAECTTTRRFRRTARKDRVSLD